MEPYLGHNASFWLELEKQARKLDVVDYLQEIGDLRAKVSFYESRVNQMLNFMKKYLEVNLE